MQNFKLTISYDGTRFSGWQKQNANGDTIQGKLESIASLLNGRETPVNGAGRTDAGVHAKGQVANVFIDKEMTPEEVRDHFNRYLPETVSVDKVETADSRFHARLSAKAKTYEYYVSTEKKPPVFERRFVYCYGKPVNIDSMRLACEDLKGTHDFKGFCTRTPGKKSTVREIMSADVTVVSGGLFIQESLEMPRIIKITLSGDGFLYNQVRIIAGTLLEIGSGSLPGDTVKKVLETGDRKLAGFTAPPEGLFLKEVIY